MDISKLFEKDTYNGKERIADMALLNKGDMSILPYNKYKVYVYGEDHQPPHFHVETTEFDARFDLEGNFLSMKRGEISNVDVVEKLVKKWLNSKPAKHEIAVKFATNSDFAEVMWIANN